MGDLQAQGLLVLEHGGLDGLEQSHGGGEGVRTGVSQETRTEG